ARGGGAEGPQGAHALGRRTPAGRAGAGDDAPGPLAPDRRALARARARRDRGGLRRHPAPAGRGVVGDRPDRGELHPRRRRRRRRPHPGGGPDRAQRPVRRAGRRPDGGRDVPGLDRGGALVTDVVAILANGVVYGSIYGLVAIGMTLIYGTLRILAMSPGSMVMIGGYIGWR